ncbi:anti-sigma-I factor RsgI family protein [Natranaerobius thermophilus]|uniref:RsgI N-terminal anti-sigma domain-containing protein n=1 Tax=Natranaerobius thermophilus (strain ATCC BAA-1301 / DSM 18059 / JW/NM-WN-LF) TaxID=457570 RepID=B2A762_NATTJ|nr:anti-sigma factor domain-containing protein [Natranaerobius thermophilus]ACB84256.1 hypothetical protein Nther_0662 [Natranaerobius thermophilus JW/NM-WN-LF]
MSKIKAVVIKTEKNYMHVATEDRRFLRVPIPEKGVAKGEEVWIDPENIQEDKFIDTRNSVPPSIKNVVSIAAIFMLLIISPFLSDLFFESDEAVAYLNVDINPGFELAVNSDYKVIEAVPLNETAKDLFQEIQLEDKYLTNSMSKLVNTAREKGYIYDEMDNLIMITLVNVDQVNQKDLTSSNYQNLRDEILTGVEDTEITANIALREGTMAELNQAREQGITLNDYKIKAEVAHTSEGQVESTKEKSQEEIDREKMITELRDEGRSVEELYDEVTQIGKSTTDTKKPSPPDHTPPGQDEQKPPGQREEHPGRSPEEKPPGQDEEKPPGQDENGHPGQRDDDHPGQRDEIPPGQTEDGPPGHENDSPGTDEGYDDKSPGHSEEGPPGQLEQEPPGEPPGQNDNGPPGQQDNGPPGHQQDNGPPGHQDDNLPGKQHENGPPGQGE